MKPALGTLVLVLILAACRAEAAPPTLPAPLPTPTMLRVAVPATQMPAQPDEPTPAPCPAETGPALRYDLNAIIDMKMYTVRATEVVHFRNETGGALDEIVLEVDPNRQPGVFSLVSLSLADDGEELAYELTGPRLTVTLPEALGGNCTTSIQMDFVLAPLPIPTVGFQGSASHLGFDQRQFNLGHWFPTVAAYQGDEGWLLHEAYGTGEHYALPAADFNVELTVESTGSPMVVGPGTVEEVDDDTWRFSQAGSRDMAFSISEMFDRVSARTESGVRVEVYYFTDAEENREAALHSLDVAVAAMARYEMLFGPSPFDRVAVVTSDFPDGMEFSGLVFVGEEYFRYYNGSPAGWLTLITAHELAHQWWYALVGNDQAIAPWLDEALATYCEHLFLEATYPDLASWWWDFRVNAYEPQGDIGRPIYEYSSRREYINVNYLRGVMMLRDLRSAIGDESFIGWLRAYASAYGGELAQPEDFWSIMPAGIDAEAVDRVRESYGLGEKD
jgi:hypothetical protein